MYFHVASCCFVRVTLFKTVAVLKYFAVSTRIRYVTASFELSAAEGLMQITVDCGSTSYGGDLPVFFVRSETRRESGSRGKFWRKTSVSYGYDLGSSLFLCFTEQVF